MDRAETRPIAIVAAVAPPLPPKARSSLAASCGSCSAIESLRVVEIQGEASSPGAVALGERARIAKGSILERG